jgi:hypothetical protein
MIPFATPFFVCLFNKQSTVLHFILEPAHLSIHPSRQNTMAAMIFSVLCSNNVHHQSLARYVDSPNPKAALRKVERFFLQ